MATAATQAVAIPIGTIKSFGEHGPMYEVLGPAPRGPKGEMVSVRVVHGGETLAYPLNDMLADPQVP
jgi:Family of unknown function (DUF5397)